MEAKARHYLKAVAAAGELFNIHFRIHIAEQRLQEGIQEGTAEERMERLRQLGDEQNRVMADFRSARTAAAIVLTEEATAVMDAYQNSSRSTDDPEFHKKGMEALNHVYSELRRLARHELKISDAITKDINR